MISPRLTFFPSDPFTPVPDLASFTEHLLQAGFLETDSGAPTGFVLGRIFKEMLSDAYPDLEYARITVWAEVFTSPRIQAGADLEQLGQVKTAGGREIGDTDTARELLSLLREDPQAEWYNTDIQRLVPIHELDFDGYVAFGSHFLHLSLYLRPTENFLRLLSERLGIAYRFAYFRE